MIASPPLVFRMIDPDRDGDLAFRHYRDASIASYGRLRDPSNIRRYLPWLRNRVDEFPDGHLFAFIASDCVGQLELQVPYGLATGYVNLFYVAKQFRRQGFGRQLHARAEQYFRSWEATKIELDVSPSNKAAVKFYQAMGYQLSPKPSPFHPLRRLEKSLS